MDLKTNLWTFSCKKALKKTVGEGLDFTQGLDSYSPQNLCYVETDI